MRNLLARIVYPLHEYAKGHKTTEAYARALERDRWSREQVREFQFTRLRKLIDLAYEKSGFYRKHFDTHGISPATLKSVQDLERFPFVDKAVIRANRDEMLTVDPARFRELITFSTGGSTGEPLVFYIDRHRAANEWAACWRARSWWGLTWGDSWVWLWGSPIELSASDFIKGTIKRIRNYLLNRDLLSAFNMSPSTMGRYADVIRRRSPRYIYAYSSAAYLLAQFILQRGIDLSPSPPRVIFTTSDNLYPHMRETITAAFHCPVSVEYGSRDCGFVAHECPQGRIHIHSDRVLLEVVRGDQPVGFGELGEIVATVLDATAMPFVRYRTGDVGALEDGECSCGRPFPILRSIEGRSSDLLLAPGDRLVHGEAITYVIRQIHGIKAFQVIQEAVDELRIEIVLSHPQVQLPRNDIRKWVEGVFGVPVRLEIRVVDDIPPASSGKHRYVISKVAGRYFERTSDSKACSGR
jgi:phenylacetate-CoA ligase